jgi:glycosyltransferase involved in cell wall biosynthesis
LTRVLVVSNEPVGGVMAGPAIRSLELARALADECEVTLAAPPPSHVDDPRIGVLEATIEDFEVLLDALRAHDVVVAQQLPAQLLRYVTKLPIRYVADMYNPLVFEQLESLTHAEGPRLAAVQRRHVRRVRAQAAAADFIICASEKQRDLWLGGLGLSGLIALESYRRDRTYRAFVDVVPFGVADRPPVHRGSVLKGVWPGIEPEDHVVLWGGGVWRWLDALTPMRAVQRLWEEGRRVHLVFLGVQRPGADGDAPPSTAGQAVAFAREHGLEGRCVHFNYGWVPYEERQSWLLEADIGVSSHLDHLEARFSFRTRVLDYLWAGLPIVVTRGDSMAELAEREGLGATVDFEDDAAFARACAALLDDAERRTATQRRVRAVADSFRWKQAARPLVRYCVEHAERPVPRRDALTIAAATYGQYPAIVAEGLETMGPVGVARRMGRQLRRLLRYGA